jgi:endonuclease/exonuclease/phosphatase family metal-dependent hydrolase
MAHFKGNPAITIIVAYSPTKDTSDREKDAFYEDFQNWINSITPQNVLILAGDLNARLGSDTHSTNSRAIGKYTYHDVNDDNGKWLINYYETYKMRSTQTRFPQPKSRSWTRLHPNGRSNTQIDHILFNGKWLNSIRTVRAYILVEPNSDHQIVCESIDQPSS